MMSRICNLAHGLSCSLFDTEPLLIVHSKIESCPCSICAAEIVTMMSPCVDIKLSRKTYYFDSREREAITSAAQSCKANYIIHEPEITCREARINRKIDTRYATAER